MSWRKPAICPYCDGACKQGARACKACALVRRTRYPAMTINRDARQLLPRPVNGSCLNGCGRAVAGVGRFGGWCAVCAPRRVAAQPGDKQAAAWAMVGEGIT